jgi:TRAP transporter 4TM/12TM fusion protein
MTNHVPPNQEPPSEQAVAVAGPATAATPDLVFEVDKVEERIQEIEGGVRKLAGLWPKVVSVVCVLMSAYHFYTAGWGVLEAMKQRSLHLAFGLFVLFLLYPANRKSQAQRDKLPIWDIALSITGAVASLYVYFNYNKLMIRAGAPQTLDIVMGVIALVLVLEACRRAVGMALVILAGFFISYAYFGPYIPGILAHRGFPVKSIIEHLYLTTEGLFGVPLGVSATFVFTFILFGAVLEKTGAGQWFIDLAISVFGPMRGGPAKAAVIASGMMGSISGSSVANVVTTGTFTIPLMRKVGFKPHVAGGVEVAASTSGQMMPPVMGAAAFIMAEYTNIPYIQICLAAMLPAILNYAAILYMVHLESCKSGIMGIPRAECERPGQVLRRGWLYLVPVVGIVYMLVKGFTPLRAAFIGILLALGAGVLKRENRLTLKGLAGAFEQGARNSLGVVAACAATGFIIGSVTQTGLGLKLSKVVMDLAGGNLWLTLFFTMIMSILLGMGLPTTAKYIVLTTITAPTLVGMGVPLLAAHLFVFYYACAADDTPPVALAGYAAAGIARSNPVATGWMGFKFDFAAFLIPYTFIFAPALILLDRNPVTVISVFLTALAGIIAFSAFLQNWFVTRALLWERLALFAAAIVLIDPGLVTDIVGASLLAVVWFAQRARVRAGADAGAGTGTGAGVEAAVTPGV